ncbi:MAG: VOC family protein [Saprospiraceae bacterium]|nr:VOC family protein [Saprospiraceae bacterium]
MLITTHPKLPMRNKSLTKEFYIAKLGFQDIGTADYDGYLMVKKDGVEIHFFEYKDLNPHENYGQVYFRTDDIDGLYHSFLENNTVIHPNGNLTTKPWVKKNFPY